MLSIHQFRRLSLKQKLIAIDRKGIDLSLALFTDTETSTLYWLTDFYVEIIFEKGAHRVKMIRCFKGMRYLTRYLEQINIDDLTILLSYS